MKLTDLTLLCLEDAKDRKTLVQVTRKNYKSHIFRFIRFVGVSAEIEALTAEQIFAYVRFAQTDADVGGLGLSPRTIAVQWNAMGYFCRWLVTQGYLPSNPMPSRKTVGLLRCKPPTRHTTSLRIVEALLDAANALPTFYKKRARCVLFLLSTTGVRHTELLKICLSDVSLSEGYIRVHGKGDKPRTLYPPPDALQAISEWLLVRPAAVHDGLLTHQDRIRPFGQDALIPLLKRLCESAGIPDYRDCLPHAQRRGTACRLLQNGVDIHAIRTILGHSSIAITEMYLSTSNDRLRQLAPMAALPKRKQDSSPSPVAYVTPLEPPPVPDVRSAARKKSKAERVPLWQQAAVLKKIQREQKAAGQ